MGYILFVPSLIAGIIIIVLEEIWATIIILIDKIKEKINNI